MEKKRGTVNSLRKVREGLWGKKDIASNNYSRNRHCQVKWEGKKSGKKEEHTQRHICDFLSFWETEAGCTRGRVERNEAKDTNTLFP